MVARVRLSAVAVAIVLGSTVAGCGSGAASPRAAGAGGMLRDGRELRPLSVPGVVGVMVFALGPSPIDVGRRPVRVRSVRVADVPAGLDVVLQGLQPTPRGPGYELGAWQAEGPGGVLLRGLRPAVGARLLPGAGPTRRLVFGFTVDRPGTWTAKDVVVEYETPDHTHHVQVLPWTLTVERAVVSLTGSG